MPSRNSRFLSIEVRFGNDLSKRPSGTENPLGGDCGFSGEQRKKDSPLDTTAPFASRFRYLTPPPTPSPPSTGPYPTAARVSLTVRNAPPATRAHSASRSAPSASTSSESNHSRRPDPNAGASPVPNASAIFAVSGSTVPRQKARLAS